MLKTLACCRQDEKRLHVIWSNIGTIAYIHTYTFAPICASKRIHTLHSFTHIHVHLFALKYTPSLSHTLFHSLYANECISFFLSFFQSPTWNHTRFQYINQIYRGYSAEVDYYTIYPQ